MAPIIVSKLSAEEREALRLKCVADREARETAKAAEEAARVERKRMSNRMAWSRWHERNPGKGRELRQCWREANHERVRAQNAEWIRNNRGRFRELCRGGHLQRKYGITTAQWETLFDAQGRRCANLECRADAPGSKSGWHVDHCHITGEIRGILCHHCNTGLGSFRDDPALLRGAADYLEKHAMQRLKCEPLEVEDA